MEGSKGSNVQSDTISVHGNVGAIVCPMLEDELVFGLENDPDKKNIYIVNNGYTETFIGKLEKRSIEYQLIANMILRPI